MLARRDDLAAAVALCRGELLPDLGEDWADQARSAHHRRHGDLLDRLAAAAEGPRPRRGDPLVAARCDLDPLDEAAHARLLQRLATAGDRSGGLLAGREFARRLRAELGLDPGPAVRAAIAELRGPGGSASPGVGARLRPMFGRSAELAT